MSPRSVVQSRIKTLSRRGEWICAMLIFAICGYCLFLIVQPDEALAMLQRGLPGPLTRPTNTMLYAAIAVQALPVMIFLYMILQTRNLFRIIGKGLFLTDKAQRLVIRLGKLALVLPVLGILTKTLVALLITASNSPGERLLLIEVNSDQIASIITAVLLFTLSLLMKESAAIKDENESII